MTFKRVITEVYKINFAYKINIDVQDNTTSTMVSIQTNEIEAGNGQLVISDAIIQQSFSQTNNNRFTINTHSIFKKISLGYKLLHRNSGELIGTVRVRSYYPTLLPLKKKNRTVQVMMIASSD